MDTLARHFIEKEPRRHIGTIFDIEVATTPGWWLQPLGMLFGGLLLGRLSGKPEHRMRRGLSDAALLGAASAVHQLGHIASARLVHAPMDTLLVTPIRTYTLYDDADKTITRQQDIGRALGGPTANITVGFGALLLSRFVKYRSLRFFGIISAITGLAALIPVAGNDGVELFRANDR